MLAAQPSAYAASVAERTDDTPPEPCTDLKVCSAATNSCTLATWIASLSLAKL
jgi:hypothetical protein